MNSYYNEKKKSAINTETDCCSFEEWMKDKQDYACCKHQDGNVVNIKMGMLLISRRDCC